MKTFQERLQQLQVRHKSLLARPNVPCETHNGIFQRWQHPAVTAAHTPLFWRYDFRPEHNPFLMERMGINAAFNAGAIYWEGKYLLMVRVEGYDRKSFFAVAESPNGVDQFRFWDYPVVMPETDNPDTNVYDMRLTAHEDGWVYGLFCTERKDLSRPDDMSAAEAQCGIARTRDLVHW
ncbi:MAG: glycosidase, partial [Bacteroidota bacterium]